MRKYKFLIFDLDNTLINDFENMKYAFNIVLKHMGESYTEEKFIRWYNLDTQFWANRQYLTIPDEYRFPMELMIKWIRSQRFMLYFNNITLEKAMELNDLYINNLNEIVIPIDSAYEILKYLSSKYDIIVGTNGPSIAINSKLKKINCLQFVKHTLAGDMIGYMKPTVEFFEYIKNTVNCHDTDKYLVIGDSLKFDIKGAMNANMDSCWFNKNNEPLEDEYKPTIIINALEELQKLL